MSEFENFRNLIAEERQLIYEMDKWNEQLLNSGNLEKKRIINSHLNSIKNKLKNINSKIPEELNKYRLHQKLKEDNKEVKEEKEEIEFKLNNLEKETLKRLKKREDIKDKRIEVKPSFYVKFAASLFRNPSAKLTNKKIFAGVKKDLTKASLNFLPINYISLILLNVGISVILSIFLFLFLLFFNINPSWPILTSVSENIFMRMLKVFWVLILIPFGTFLFMYFYPAMERKASENKIENELPFATIHMSAISGSMIDPSKIFSIIISTKEYPTLNKEFIRLMNSINIYGYDLVTALRMSAENSPSKKLSELFNGLATTITSGGDLPEFFEKRAEGLLFEYRLEREKYTRTAETFMDIYISVVIAAPMILMLLLIMMKVSGLGISLSTGMISLVMVLGVTAVNIVFLTFLSLKQPKT